MTRILKGESKRSDCVISNTDIEVTVNGKPLKMVPFVQDILRNTALGVLRELNGYQEGADIKITIGRPQ
jgi:molybdopterin-guanine dinucleotide biosynthesis protein B